MYFGQELLFWQNPRFGHESGLKITEIVYSLQPLPLEELLARKLWNTEYPKNYYYIYSSIEVYYVFYFTMILLESCKQLQNQSTNSKIFLPA